MGGVNELQRRRLASGNNTVIHVLVLVLVLPLGLVLVLVLVPGPAAARLGFYSKGSQCLSGDELDQLDLQQLSQMVHRVRTSRRRALGRSRSRAGSARGRSDSPVCWSLQISVFYRASPRHKLKIVKVNVCVCV